ncbi:MAG: cupredoxin family copper-binding protein [Methanoregula sp.]|nr:cupredoxin family copper-binding protein [Methanoregula sp.]
MLIIACMAAGCSSTTTQSAVTTQSDSSGGARITIKNFAFDPPAITVKAGTAITWTNQDSSPHTIVSDSGSPVPFSSESFSSGAAYTFTFTHPGTYTYHCSIHPSMKGTVMVE